MARIVRIHEYGDPSVLKIEDIEVPPPASREVQIEVKNIGLNRAEVMFRIHAYPQEAHFPSRVHGEFIESRGNRCLVQPATVLLPAIRG